MLHDRWGRPFIPFPDLSLHDIYADHGNAAAEVKGLTLSRVEHCFNLLTGTS